MEMFVVSEAWKADYPGASAGVLALRNVANPERHAGLDARKVELENDLRARYAGWDRAAIAALPTIQAYDAYYKRFKKTYHVQLQIESVAFKGKSIPSVAALVEAMFMAELKNLLLTAGHDLNVLEPPVTLDVAKGSESYVLLNGQEAVLKEGDMFIADRRSVMSSIIYGPDRRTAITAGTRSALFTIYAPPGIEQQAVYAHLEDIKSLVEVVAPGLEVEMMKVF